MDHYFPDVPGLGNVALSRHAQERLVSDGISEATDSRGDLYGEDRLRALWQGSATAPLSEFIDRLLTDVETFRGRAGQSDDMTVVVVGPRAGT